MTAATTLPARIDWHQPDEPATDSAAPTAGPFLGRLAALADSTAEQFGLSSDTADEIVATVYDGSTDDMTLAAVEQLIADRGLLVDYAADVHTVVRYVAQNPTLLADGDAALAA